MVDQTAHRLDSVTVLRGAECETGTENELLEPDPLTVRRPLSSAAPTHISISLIISILTVSQVITSAKEVMFLSDFVCLFVCV